jgi:hypothetical protein
MVELGFPKQLSLEYLENSLSGDSTNLKISSIHIKGAHHVNFFQSDIQG